MTSTGIIRDKEFAKRLELACERHPHAPSGHGRQKWLRETLLEQFHVKLSPEALRKWFAGEARPRPKVMSEVARALEVDEAWLSLGITPDVTPREKQKRNAEASGAVNLVAGQIQLAGGNIAFPDEDGESEDIFAIVRGRRHALTIRLGNADVTFKLTVPLGAIDNTIIAVVPTNRPSVYDFIRVPSDLVQKHGKPMGGYVEVEVEHADAKFTIANDRLPFIHSFSDLDGELSKT